MENLEQLSSSVENLDASLRNEMYHERCSFLRDQLAKIDVLELEINEEDLKDKHCDPEHPVRITFNDISAAAYRIRAGIEMTPCKV
jgi:hypothetical protein